MGSTWSGVGGGSTPAHLDLDSPHLLDDMCERPVEYWCLIPPDELHRVLSRIDPEVRCARVIPCALHTLAGGDGTGPWPAARPPHPPHAVAAQGIFDTVDAALLRAAGQPRAALRHAAQIADAPLSAATSLFDNTHGWRPYLALQRGVTTLLAGDFGDAALHLGRATFWRSPRHLGNIERDAHAKLALLHAFVGDAGVAPWHLRAVAATPPSQSWSEPEVAATARLAHLALDDSRGGAPDGTESVGDDDDVFTSSLREMWPFALWLQARLLLQQRRSEDASALLDHVERAAPPGIAGDGIAASIIPATRTLIWRQRNEFALAHAALDRADPECDLTLLARAHLTLAGGGYTEAADLSRRLAARTRDLRRMHLAAIGIGAAAALRRGDTGGASEALRPLIGDGRPFTPAEAAWLPRDALALAHGLLVAASPEAASESSSGGRRSTPAQPALTPGERQMLALLASPMTRQEIASELYLSINTIKTRIHRLYRRLGVDSRADAVSYGRRTGLLS
ncbi:helix-turn-helix transcriptional regulator [Microbacterium sp. LRZ72]|uniref:helix-turn-helix transcriptional regulator n=1 Tax=Microbacterium sp. LRZ72 TaxID=2942481 RepID=UPI0029A4B246|nr:helix-turn-helix transcriptional regulator [Microbacterium sp. LRZ72]MDX2376574.1 helix-turn-helix transcriptional regulator [Microbacterium sp. LRZ72]